MMNIQTSPDIPAPGDPIEVTVTLETKIKLDPKFYEFGKRSPNQMMDSLEQELQASKDSRTWLVCADDHKFNVVVDQSLSQSKGD